MTIAESASLKYIYITAILVKEKKRIQALRGKIRHQKKSPKDSDNTITHSRIPASDSYSIYALSMY